MDTGLTSIDFGHDRSNFTGTLPIVIRPKPKLDNVTAWFSAHRVEILQLVRKAGAILFRGFPISDVDIFSNIVSIITPTVENYSGGTSPRVKIKDGVYTSTEYPRQYEISLHNEMSYSLRWPDFLYFFCVTPPGSGGETSIADSRRIMSSIAPEIVEKFERLGVGYRRNLFGRKSAFNSWAKAYETEDRAAVERHCREWDTQYEWLDDDGLQTTEIRAATRFHPITEEKIWFNQAHLWHVSNSPFLEEEDFAAASDLPMNCVFGDGTTIDVTMLKNIRQVMNEEKKLVSWEKGDLLLLDNVLVAHGRMPFSGNRKIVVTMSSIKS